MWRILVVLLAVVSVANADELPKSWHGTWNGLLVITPPSNKTTEIPISLKIEPVKDSENVTWAITYHEKEKDLVKDYTLKPNAKKPGLYDIDENNGIVLPARLVKGVLLSVFEVEGNLLTARYELTDGAINFEVTSASKQDKKTGNDTVQGYTVTVVQSAKLKKK
jgi:hypothetical protein